MNYICSLCNNTFSEYNLFNCSVCDSNFCIQCLEYIQLNIDDYIYNEEIGCCKCINFYTIKNLYDTDYMNKKIEYYNNTKEYIQTLKTNKYINDFKNCYKVFQTIEYIIENKNIFYPLVFININSLNDKNIKIYDKNDIIEKAYDYISSNEEFNLFYNKYYKYILYSLKLIINALNIDIDIINKYITSYNNDKNILDSIINRLNQETEYIEDLIHLDLKQVIKSYNNNDLKLEYSLFNNILNCYNSICDELYYDCTYNKETTNLYKYDNLNKYLKKYINYDLFFDKHRNNFYKKIVNTLDNCNVINNSYNIFYKKILNRKNFHKNYSKYNYLDYNFINDFISFCYKKYITNKNNTKSRKYYIKEYIQYFTDKLFINNFYNTINILNTVYINTLNDLVKHIYQSIYIDVNMNTENIYSDFISDFKQIIDMYNRLVIIINKNVRYKNIISCNVINFNMFEKKY